MRTKQSGTKCMVVGCEKPAITFHFCRTHYRRWNLYGDPFHVEPMGIAAKDLTGKRFERLVAIKRINDGKKNIRWLCKCDCGNETISVSGSLINGTHKSCGCYKSGPTNYKAKPKTITNGYVSIIDKSHPRANKRTGRVREHIVVMEKMIGRYLLPHEEVHHKNGVRDDNAPSNLELWSISHPAGQRVEDKVEWAIQLLTLYAPERLTL